MVICQDFVLEWLFEYGCLHHMRGVLHEIANNHESIWKGDLCSIPPILPLMAVVQDIVETEAEDFYEDVIDISAALYATFSSFVTCRDFARLSVGFKSLVIFRMLRNSSEGILARLNTYFPRKGFHCPNADKQTEMMLNQSQLGFRQLILRLNVNEAKKRAYLKNNFEEDYGKEFWSRLKQLFKSFLLKIETALPVSAIDKLFTSAPDSEVMQELTASDSPAVELLLDAMHGRDYLSETQVLEILKWFRKNDSSVRIERPLSLGVGIFASPVELNQNEETNEVQKTNMRNRKRIHSDSVEDEVSHESLCNNGMKCVQPQAENGHFPEQQKTKEVKDQRVENCSPVKVSPKKARLATSLIMESAEAPDIENARAVDVDRCTMRTVAGMDPYESPAAHDCEKINALENHEDRAPTGTGWNSECAQEQLSLPSTGDSRNSLYSFSPKSQKSTRQELTSVVSPSTCDAVPDTPTHVRHITQPSIRLTSGVSDSQFTDLESYVGDSEDAESCISQQAEIIPSSYSFDKFDLIVRDKYPTVALPLLGELLRTPSRLCIVKLSQIPDLDHVTVDGKNIKIFR